MLSLEYDILSSKDMLDFWKEEEAKAFQELPSNIQEAIKRRWQKIPDGKAGKFALNAMSFFKAGESEAEGTIVQNIVLSSLLDKNSNDILSRVNALFLKQEKEFFFSSWEGQNIESPSMLKTFLEKMENAHRPLSVEPFNRRNLAVIYPSASEISPREDSSLENKTRDRQIDILIRLREKRIHLLHFKELIIKSLLAIPYGDRLKKEAYQRLFDSILRDTPYLSHEEKEKLFFIATLCSIKSIDGFHESAKEKEILLLISQANFFNFERGQGAFDDSFREEDLQGVDILNLKRNLDRILNDSDEDSDISLIDAESVFAESTEELKERFLHGSGVKFSLLEEELDLIMQYYRQVEECKSQWSRLELIELQSLAAQIQLKIKNAACETEDLLSLLAIGCLAIKREFHIDLYNTQILAALTILSSMNRKEIKGRLAQVKTGEGKSLIVSSIALTLVLSGRTVDIISSSKYLATRDQKKFKDFFNRFEIISSHICDSDPPKECFKAHILYGQAQDFEFAVMREILYFIRLYEARAELGAHLKSFDCVLVDEVDNLLVDTALNSARLSMEGKGKLFWAYQPIFNFVQKKLHGENFRIVHEKNTLYGLAKYLTACEEGRHEKQAMEIPEKILKELLVSAFSACYILKENVDYVIQSGKGEREEFCQRVKIVDRVNTGQISENCRWNYGTHEFCEIKHQLPMGRDSIVPISLSHPIFYSYYTSLFGLSGTLGSSIDREEVKTIYQVDTVDIPLHRASKREEYPAKVYSSREEHRRKILEEIEEMRKIGRPVLVLCASIKETLSLSEEAGILGIPFQIYNEVQKEESEFLIGQAGEVGKVTFATNNSGRGTDIKLSIESLSKGGLHVLLTFYPENQRVEEQAFGRSGRQGEEGSVQMIICMEDLRSLYKLPLNFSFNSREIRSFLDELRLLKNKEQYRKRLQYARMRKSVEEQSQDFWPLLKSWKGFCEDERNLSILAGKLKAIYLPEESGVRRFDISLEEKIIAEDCLELIRSSDATIEAWIFFLQRLILKIESNAIENWAVFYFQPAEEICYGNVLIKEKERRIQELFVENREHWEKYLTEEISGLTHFISDLTGIDFSILTALP